MRPYFGLGFWGKKEFDFGAGINKEKRLPNRAVDLRGREKIR